MNVLTRCGALRGVVLAVLVLTGLPVLSSGQGMRGPGLPVEVPALIPANLNGWLWATGERLEVLSLCPEDNTRVYVQNILRQRANLAALIPEDLRISWDRPMLVLLYGEEQPRPVPEAFATILSGSLTRAAREQAAENREGKPTPVTVQTFPIMSIWAPDADSIIVFSAVPSKVRASELSELPAAEYVRYLLEARSPPLPAWLIDSIGGLFTRSTAIGTTYEASPIIWISPAQSQLMVKNKSIPAELVPLSELFAYANHASRPTDERRLLTLRSQGELLVRWALEGRCPGGIEALWTFVRGIRPDSDLEALFTSSFGMSTAAALDSLRGYLPTALRKPLRLRLARAPGSETFQLRPATPSEIARVKGEWERIAGRMVALSHPILRPHYFEAAERTLAASLNDAQADPELLVARGLLAVEVGRDAEALPLLEAASRTPHPRPRAVVELARIRLAQARAAAGPEGKLDAATVATIAEPLRALSGTNPPISRAFQVLAETWIASEQRPAAEDIRLLTEAVLTHPNEVATVIAVARLLLEIGERDQALTMIEAGLAHITDDGSRRRLFALRSAARAASPRS